MSWQATAPALLLLAASASVEPLMRYWGTPFDYSACIALADGTSEADVRGAVGIAPYVEELEEDGGLTVKWAYSEREETPRERRHRRMRAYPVVGFWLGQVLGGPAYGEVTQYHCAVTFRQGHVAEVSGFKRQQSQPLYGP